MCAERYAIPPGTILKSLNFNVLTQRGGFKKEIGIISPISFQTMKVGRRPGKIQRGICVIHKHSNSSVPTIFLKLIYNLPFAVIFWLTTSVSRVSTAASTSTLYPCTHPTAEVRGVMQAIQTCGRPYTPINPHRVLPCVKYLQLYLHLGTPLIFSLPACVIAGPKKKKEKRMSTEVFGSTAPYAEPLWYSRGPAPHHKASHLRLRAEVRKYIDEEILPNAFDWETAGRVPAAVGGLGPFPLRGTNSWNCRC